MDDATPDAIADVAYGLFEHMLTHALAEAGRHLYQRVEGHEDFRAAFEGTFTQFEAAYPDLAQAIRTKFGSTGAVYAMISDGEGVIPSRTRHMYWIVQDAPGMRPDAVEDELAGKWLIFLPPEEIDDAWKRVRNATTAGELGISSKASTAKENPDSRDSMKVIYIYTADWRDEGDVMRVRERLREIGFNDRIGYKRNIETFRGEYSQKGKRVTYYSA